jgi:hypothetical protein
MCTGKHRGRAFVYTDPSVRPEMMMRVLELSNESSDGNSAVSLASAAVRLGTLPPTISHLLIVNKLPSFPIRPAIIALSTALHVSNCSIFHFAHTVLRHIV